MRRIGVLVMAAALASCGAQQERETPDVEDSAGPGIAVTAAPGVAFNYRYAFRLPAPRIAATQEAHAQACERLGIARCRITGMRYTVSDGYGIDAMLSFKLAPAIARVFGRQGIVAIEQAEGMLTDAEITGVDAGQAIARGESDRSRIAQERGRIDTELARPGIGSAARAELLRQRATLDESIRAATAEVAGQRETLASTPMTFTYASGQAIRGFDATSPFARAADTAIGSVQWTLAVVLWLLAALVPPALALLVVVLLWRRFGSALKRWWLRERAAE
ncbi:hypothetical protein [Sphingomonas sp. RS2018]